MSTVIIQRPAFYCRDSRHITAITIRLPSVPRYLPYHLDYHNITSITAMLKYRNNHHFAAITMSCCLVYPLITVVIQRCWRLKAANTYLVIPLLGDRWLTSGLQNTRHEAHHFRNRISLGPNAPPPPANVSLNGSTLPFPYEYRAHDRTFRLDIARCGQIARLTT